MYDGYFNKTGSFQEDNVVAMEVKIYKPLKENEYLTVKRQLLCNLPSIGFSLVSSFPSQLYFHSSKQYSSSYTRNAFETLLLAEYIKPLSLNNQILEQ